MLVGQIIQGMQSHDAQQTTLINEGNVYRLITKSKMPSAEKFEEWIFEEVLPFIRKTGTYSAGINRLKGIYTAAILL